MKLFRRPDLARAVERAERTVQKLEARAGSPGTAMVLANERAGLTTTRSGELARVEEELRFPLPLAQSTLSVGIQDQQGLRTRLGSELGQTRETDRKITFDYEYAPDPLTLWAHFKSELGTTALISGAAATLLVYGVRERLPGAILLGAIGSLAALLPIAETAHALLIRLPLYRLKKWWLRKQADETELRLETTEGRLEGMEAALAELPAHGKR